MCVDVYSISGFRVCYMKFVPPLIPIAKLYVMRNLGKSVLFCLFIVEVKALRHPPPTATGLSFVGSLKSL